jgi:hypothetical protein
MTHRWSTPALFGPWCASADDALCDALRWGQAVRHAGRKGEIVLQPFAALEVRERLSFQLSPE